MNDPIQTCTLIQRLVVASLLLAFAVSVTAHEAKLSSTPEDGASIEGSPETIGIEFEGAMRITRFEVTGPDGRVPLTDEPGNDPTEAYFVQPAEPLPPGRYEVVWRGLARDGHMMSGGFSFTVVE